MAGSVGGDKLAAYLEKYAANVNTARSVEIGFLEGSTYPDGTSLPMVMAVQEFGSPKLGIPPRPYFRSMINDNRKEWPATIATLLKANDYDAAKTLGQVGAMIKGQLQQSIVNTNTPPNAPSTIARKGSSKPLVDTGHALASVDYRVTT